MDIFQAIFVAFFGAFSFSGFVLGVKNCVQKRNPYGLTKRYNLIGSFVWADAVVFGAFWVIVSVVSLILSSWALFLLTQSIFWLIRSLGETIYWFNQQFAVKNRNPVHTLWISKFFPGDSAWVAMQIFWQCVAVLTSVSTIYLVKIYFNI